MMCFGHSYLPLRTHFIVFNVFIIVFLKYAWSEICVQQNNCRCVFPNGSHVDLTSLGYQGKPRWENQKPSQSDSYLYSYNPCFSFKIGPSSSECAKGVAVCQLNQTENMYYNCGNPDDVKFDINSTAGNLQITYTNNAKSTTVTLHCSQNATTPQLEVIGEISVGKYAMHLTSICACPDMCSSSHLSAGSVLVIIFMIFVSLYLVLGIIHSSLTRGAHGWELIPHYEFWADFPLLVRDGCVFVVSGCKTETAYERI